MAADPETIINDPPAGDPPGDPPVVVDPPVGGAGDPPAGDPPAGDPPAGDPPAPPANDDWRAGFKDIDDKAKGWLGRYASPKAFIESAKKLHDDFRQGKFLKPLGEGATEDEVAAYRAALNVPEAPEGYAKALPEGMVIGADEKPVVDAFMAEMHKINAPPAAVNAALSAYYGMIETQQTEALAEAKAAKTESEEALREEWGQDYRRNVNIVRSFVEGLPEDVKGVFLSGSDAAGLPIANNAAVLRWLVGAALEANPADIVLPGAGTNAGASIEDELKTIRAKMGTKEYVNDPKMQQRYRDLVEAREKLKARGG